MPVGLEARLQQILNEVVIISQGIRSSALAYANNRNFHVFERLRRQLETIRISADTILEAITKASLTSYTIDDRLTDWLISGELRSCLDKLKEMEDILKPDGRVWPARAPAPPLTSAEDKLTETMAFFDKHSNVFHFLVTSDVWNRERLLHQPSEIPQIDILPTAAEETECDPQRTQTSSIKTTEHEHDDGEDGFLSNTNQSLTPKRRKELLPQKLDEVSRWLAAWNCTEKHKHMLRLRQEGTCAWFPKTDIYEKWRVGGSSNQFLWLHGTAGCGKSVLVASTIEHLREKLRYEEALLFFYCDFQNERSTSSVEVMRSLFYQLLCYFRDRSVDPGDHLNKLLEEKKEGTLSLNDLGKLCDLVSRFSRSLCYEPIVVIDALDECADMEELLGVLATLIQGDVRLLVTSRPHPIILRHFAGLQSLSLQDMAKELAEDIALHVSRVLDSHSRLRSAVRGMKNEICEKLNEKANGRFRWVQCQLDTLKRCTTEWELKEALADLPTELEVTYERILEAIDERKSEGELARRALAWLVVALEPLRLAQVVEGLSVNLQQPMNGCETRWPKAALLEALSSLVSYHEETDVLTLSHFSVKEYLTGHMALPKYHIVSHEAHAEVAQMCMNYVTVFLKQGIRRGVAPLESFPTLSYVLSSGFNHIAHVDPGSTAVLETLESFGSDIRHHPSHWDRLCQFREEELRWPYPLWPSSKHDLTLYILIAYSSSGLLRSFLSNHRPLKPRIGTNPLVYAADLRKTEHGLALLACGADVNMRSLAIDDSHQALPLEVAIDRGEDVLVGELLQRGCVVTSELLTTAVCMPWCSTRVLVQLVQTGEFVEWANAIGDEKLYRGVFNSARPNTGDRRRTDEDRVALARRLSQIGQDFSPNSPFGAELIERAVHAAHTSMLEYLLSPDQPPHPRFLLAASTGDTSETVPLIRFLLQKGVDTNAVSDGRGDTALHLATMCPWEPRSLELTKMLIDAGCSPRARNLRAETPLTIAVGRGYLSVVEHLLSSNVPLPSNILPIALSQQSTPQMVEFLIRKGADMRSTAPNGDTVLHLAISQYPESTRLILLKSFVEAGCNLTICNAKGRTILETAIERRNTSVVDFLLSCHVPLSPAILLFALRQRSTPRMVESLVRKGADVHSTASNGDTVLHLAIAEYSETAQLALVKTLIEAGCNATTCNSEGKTVFEVAIERGYTSVLGRLLSYNVPFPPDILLIALRRRSTPTMIQFLIRKGADMHSTTSDGDTVFHLAIAKYVEETCCCLVKSFIEAGCNVATCNSEGKTVLEAAIKREYTSVMELLLSSDIPFPPDILLIVLRRRSTPQIIPMLISKGADVHSTTPEGDTVLHLAITEYVEATCCYLVNSFIEAGCNPTTCNSEGKTVLEAAIERGYTSVVELLLSRNIPLPSDILLIVAWQRLPLHMLQFLIRKGANMNCTTSDGDTILHLAIVEHVEEICYDLVKTFIEAGYNPTTCNSEGKTVLEVAIERKCTSVVELLLLYNVPFPPNILLIAARQRFPPRMLRFLIDKGADVHCTTPNGDTILHLAIVEYYPECICYDVVKTFIEAGCNPTTRNSESGTVLEAAIEHGYISVVELLLSSNVPFPSDILLIAARRRLHHRMLQFLIGKGADVHCTASNGDTILHLAVAGYMRDYNLVKILIEAGCNPTICNSEGKSVLDIAIEREDISVVELLLSSNVPFPSDILLIAVRRRLHHRMLRLLIGKGADVHCTTPNGDTILHLAVVGYPELICYEVVKIFIEAGCNLTTRNSEGKTVLEAAIEGRHTLVVELLLLRNVPFPPDILLIAARQRFPPRILQSLIHKGADVHCTTSEGNTMLHLVVTEYVEEICYFLVETFIEAGCNPAICNSKGKTVLEAAIEREYSSVVELLLSCKITFPSDTLPSALRRRSSPNMIQLLVGDRGDDHAMIFGTHWETLVQTARASYSGPELDQVIEILDAARRKAESVRSALEDETAAHVAKRPRLE